MKHYSNKVRGTTIKIISFVLLFLITSGIVLSQKLDMDKLKDLKARSIGPAGMSGRVTSIAVVHNQPEIIFVGTASGGLWKSESGGIEWKPVFDKEKVASIGAVAIDQSNPDIIWAGTGEGNPRNSLNGGYGIYKSINGGKTWNLMGLEKTRHIHRVIVHPKNSDIVYVGAIGTPWGPHPERGVFKTTDGGKTWEKVLFVNELTGAADLVMDPSNPDKLFAAMWEHHRLPWFFKSGGKGSGLYMTIDGGKNWEKLKDKDGLPKGELGRIGLAIAKSNPKIIYAYIESKKNAIYRSVDGGYKWEKRGDSNIGGRPFYYAEIFVDPQNENRLYSLFTRVNISEDGGKTFSQLIGWNIHPDHHAWWIHLENPDFMINGNDGGMAITYDRGKTWRFISNLPLAQFYHINVDMELPYNVYGGMQDNGSWRGPAYTWTSGGIINTYWDNLSGGDGFDVVPDNSDSRYCYSMSQQGYVGRVDLLTGDMKSIRPVHPDGIDLRFNWNAAIAHDPFNKSTIYFGSQFVHKSTNHGESWDIISRDLTTNDPEKQKQDESGGLTYDVTGAENHTTIIVISPSTVKEDVIWVGTDDGNLQLTKDGGKTWENLAGKLKNVPVGSWIPQIKPSTYASSTAYVVVNNYRRNDYSPYLYHTTDFGKSWNRVVDETDVFGYCLSFVQDPVEPKLMFLGTEYGLYVSIDKGENWTKWTNGYPTVSTMDLVIHPREHDLVIGTFGRAAYVLDDIRPLRELAHSGIETLDKEIKAFNPPTAYLVNYKNAPGFYSGGDAYYSGDNRAQNAMITYSVKEGNENAEEAMRGMYRRDRGDSSRSGSSNENAEEKKSKKVKIRIIDSSGDTIRTLTHVPKTGVNRIQWRLDRKGSRWPGSSKPSPGSPEQGRGGFAFPGEYKLVFSYNEAVDSTFITVKVDQRIDFLLEAARKNQEIITQFMKKANLLTEAIDRVKETKSTMELVNKQIPKEKSEAVMNLRKVSKEVTDSLKSLTSILIPDESKQGIFRSDKVVTNKLRSVRMIMYSYQPLNATQKLALKQAEELITETVDKVNHFYDTSWKKYRKAVEEVNISPFTEYKTLELE